MHKFIKQVFIYTILGSAANAFALPAGFVYLKKIDHTILQDMRYVTDNNFTGKRVPGYYKGSCILTYETAMALHRVQKNLRKQHLGLKVFDCYRPREAVAAFVKWSKDPKDQKMKQDYYPHINKANLFKLSYIAEKSGHSRGSTVDLTVVKFVNKHPIELDMGTHFDFLDPTSHPTAENISPTAKKNRLLLQTAMKKEGFKPLPTEWWHFTLVNEPFINQYFNFPVR